MSTWHHVNMLAVHNMLAVDNNSELNTKVSAFFP